MLQVDPAVRPEIDVVVQATEAIGFEHCQGTDLAGPLSIRGSSIPPAAPARPPPPTPNATPSSTPAARPSAPPPPPPQSTRPSPPANASNGPSPSHVSAQTSQQQPPAAPAARGGGVFGFLRGGADSILKTVKDASSRVLESVTTYATPFLLSVTCSASLVVSFEID